MLSFSILSAEHLALALVVASLAGVVKGMVGFAMPMILISGLGSFLAPELALAGLMLPTLVTNIWQGLRDGLRAALASLGRFRLFLAVGAVCLFASAQLVGVLPAGVLLTAIGVPLVVFSIWQLLGQPLTLRAASRRIEVAMAVLGGSLGGLSGVWGPPVVVYLTALGTPKAEQMRIQGVLYLLGSIALVAAHTGSGVVTPESMAFSASLVPAALAGMWVGYRLQDRIDQAAFRRATLAVLLLAGLNLIRRGLMG